MTRDEYLAQVDLAISPVTELLQYGRMGVEKQFNPLMVQISLEAAKVLSLAAIAAGGIESPEWVTAEFAGDSPEVVPVVPAGQAPAPATNGSGLIVPG
jgi:hypothetical protein